MDRAQRDLLARYVEAFTSYDVAALVALLREDAVLSMPPFAWWLRGRADIRQALVASAGACRGDRLVPTVANGTPAFGQYRDGAPFALLIVEITGGGIGATTTCLDPGRLFPLFALPDRLPMSSAGPTRISRYDDDQ
jgi:RNA polymerase sigma-70 factor (ECF subfamily)